MELRLHTLRDSHDNKGAAKKISNDMGVRVQLTWYHSRLTPPASTPSSPWNTTFSFPRISSGDLIRPHAETLNPPMSL